MRWREHGAPLIATLLACAAVTGCGSSSSSSTAAKSSASSSTNAMTGMPSSGASNSKTVSLASGCRPSGSGDQTARTATHVFLFHVGPKETMAMPAEVRSKHLKSGEVMLDGSIASMQHMGSGMSVMRHLEVHVCNRHTGRVLTGAKPAIELAMSGGMARPVPVMAMEGIDQGVADYHYGNNVVVNPGARYVVTVRVGSDKVTFHFTAPRE